MPHFYLSPVWLLDYILCHVERPPLPWKYGSSNLKCFAESPGSESTTPLWHSNFAHHAHTAVLVTSLQHLAIAHSSGRSGLVQISHWLDLIGDPTQGGAFSTIHSGLIWWWLKMKL